MKTGFSQRRFFRCALFAIILLAWAAAPACALLEEGKYTEIEKVWFAFFRISHISPPYAEWVKISDAYNDASSDQRDSVLRDQVSRLEEGFRLYNLNEDLIKVTLTARIRLPPLTKDDLRGDFHDFKPLQVLMADGSGYFPFRFGNMQVAIVPDHFNVFQNLILSNDDFARVQEQLGLSSSTPITYANIEIAFRPTGVDLNRRFILDKKPTWLMSASIASFEIWDSHHASLAWGYTAPWLASGRAQELLDLKK